MTSDDSSFININDGLIVNGTALIKNAVTVDSTLDVSSNITVTGNLIVSSSGTTFLPAGGSVDIGVGGESLFIIGNRIESSSNSNIEITPGGTGSVDISNLTLDSSISLTDNIIKTTTSNANIQLGANGTGQVEILSGLTTKAITTTGNVDITGTKTITGQLDVEGIQIKDNTISTDESNSNLLISGTSSGVVSIDPIDMGGGTVDNVVIGGTTPAAGTFSTITFDPVASATLSTTGVTITDNTITANVSNDNLELNANSSGNIIINGFILPNADGGTGQFLQTDGSGTLSFGTVSIAFSESGLTDTETDLSFRSNTEIDHVTSTGGHDLLISAAGTADTWALTKYDSALYYSLHRDDISDEFEVAKHSVVHNNSDAFVTSYATIRTGTNNHILMDADVNGDNFRLRASGLSTGNSMSYYRVGLGDDDSTGYTGEDEVAIVIKSEIGHSVETVIDHVTSTKSINVLTSTTSSLDEFATSKYDSAFYLSVDRDDDSDEFQVVKHSVAHNNSSAVISSYSIAKTGTNNHIVTTADVDSSMVRLLGTASSSAASSSFYRIGLGDDDSTGYSGEQEAAISINTDLDSAEETIDSFSASNFRGAKYYISVNNNSKTEVSNLECLVVHNGTNAFITSFGNVDTGNQPLMNVTADIDSGNVRLRATGNEPNLRVHMYRILLADDEADREGTNVKVIGEVTVASSSTAIDTFDNVGADGATAVNAAHYIVVATNSGEGASSICEAAVVAQGNNAFITQYGMTSTKGTDQILLTAAHDGSSTVTVSATSTSGGSTTVNAYRVQLTRPAGGTTETFDSFSTSSFRGAKYFISINNEANQELNNVEVLLVHDGSNAVMTEYGNVFTGTNKLINFTADISGGNARLRATVPSGVIDPMRITAYRILLADNEADRTVNNNVSVTGDTTVSSSATTVDTFNSSTHQGAHYVVVAHDSTEGAASICEAAVVVEGTDAFVTQYAQTSTKDTGQITLTVAHDGSNTVSLKAASTSGSNTKVNLYRISLTRGEGSATAVATLDSNAISSVRSVKYTIQTQDSEGDRFELIEANVTHDGTNAYISKFAKIGNVADDLLTITVDIDSGNLRLRGQISNVNSHMINVVKRTINV